MVTARGKSIILGSIERLGFKKDEKIYVRPVYQKDIDLRPELFEGETPKTHLVIDGNHRMDWLLANRDKPGVPSTAQIILLKGKVCCTIFPL